MHMRSLGKTGISVYPLCLGGSVFGWTIDKAASFAVLDTYLEAGGNFIDTADSYSRWAPGNSGGESETIVGLWMKERATRDRVVLVSKVGEPSDDQVEAQGLSKSRVTRAIEASLRRLRTDHIDVYLAHLDDRETPLQETLEIFTDLVRQGKVRSIGASNYRADRLREAIRISRRCGCLVYEVLQQHYSLLNRKDYEAELEAVCVEESMGVMTYRALESGFLTGKYGDDKMLPVSPRLAEVNEHMNDRGYRILNALSTNAKVLGASSAQVALAWVGARPSIAAPIVSATSREQLEELVGATELELPDSVIFALNRASSLAMS